MEDEGYPTVQNPCSTKPFALYINDLTTNNYEIFPKSFTHMDMEKETGLIKDNGENYDEVTYGCDKCDFDTCSREKMASHRQNQHDRYQCKICDFAASILKELKNHKL